MSDKNPISIGKNLKNICLELKKSKSTDSDYYANLKKVDDILWDVLEPENSQAISRDISCWKTINNCRGILAGGDSFEEFCAEVRSYDDAPVCGLVWTRNFFAYRCRTCGLTPAMSLCSECFLAGNHEGHDYNMFQSQAGGACDCGDSGVMLESGFCPKHASAKEAKNHPPMDLLCVAENVLPRIFRRLLLHFREFSTINAFNESISILDFLQNLGDLGAAMRNIMSVAMLDKEVYQHLMLASTYSDDKATFLASLASTYEDTVKSLESIATQDDADALDCPELCASLEHQCFVDEFMFWLIKFEFPQKLVTFLLSLLSNSDFRVCAAEAFVKHYTRIATLLSKQQANDSVANRVIHMSVQLMSSERLALDLNNDHKLLRILVVSLHNVIKKSLTECTLHTSVRNFHRIVDLSSPILENHNYWALASDLHNVLGHKALAKAFLRDPALVDLWCNFIAFFQGMNVNTRQLDQHLEFETRTYYPAFTAEIEICAAVLWNLIHHLKDETMYDCILYTVQYVLGQIQEWFENIHFVPDSCWKPPPLSMSFHLPLHRLFSAFVCHGIKLGMQVLFPSETFMRLLFMHPLQIQVARAEVGAGMWVRNGQVMRYQSCLYVQSHFCNSFFDLDLYLMQVCGARVNPDWFILTIFDRFHLVEWLSFAPAYPIKRFLRPEWEMPMLEGALRLIATIICKTTHLGMSEDDTMRLELATLLTMGTKTHSQILDQIPDSEGIPGRSVALVEKLLPELATYQPPQFEPGGTMRQGTYVPKDIVWLQYFDPLLVMARSLQMKDYQDAFTRYTEFVRKAGLYKNKEAPWPPMPLPRYALSAYDSLRRLLHCRSLHAILYVVLYKTLANLCPLNEHVLYLVIYLLELAVQLPAPGAAVTETTSKRHTVLNLQFCGWFPGNCLFTNLCHRVDRILHIDNMPGLSRSCNDGTDTDADFPDLVRLRAKLTGSNFATTPDNQLVPSQVPRSRSGDIPFIDSMETDLDIDTDYFYKKAMSYLPSALRRQYLANSPERLALTMDADTAMFVEEVADELALVASTAERQLVAVGPSEYEEQQEQESRDQLAIEYQPNHERSLVLKQHGIVSMVDDEMHTDVDQQSQSMLPEPEAIHGLPPSAPPPQALPHPKLHVTNTGESILSMLVKLHEKLVGDGQLYRPSESNAQLRGDTPCVGDGSFYIRKLLDRFYTVSPSCRQEIDCMCASTMSKTGESSSEENAVQAKKKAARERQERLMAQFTSKQKAVMSQLMQQELANAEESDETSKDQETEPDAMVECVICNQSSSISLDRPIGLVALAVATSVFGKAYPENKSFVTSILDVTPEHKEVSRGHRENNYYRDLVNAPYSKLSCISATNMGWEGGICVTTCGHHVHSDCHETYMKALKGDPNRPQFANILIVEKGEFYCPLCRQLANCVLPLLRPSLFVDEALKANDLYRARSERRRSAAGNHEIDWKSDLSALATEVSKCLYYTSTRNVLEGTEMNKACEDFIQRLISSTYPKFNGVFDEMNAIWTFVCGVLRTNLEAEQVWHSIGAGQKRSCLRALLNLLPHRMTGLEYGDLQQSCLDWVALTGMECGLPESDDYLPLANVEESVPIILKDPIALLIRLSLFLMQNSLSVEHFAVLSQALYNLVVFQSTMTIIVRRTYKLPVSLIRRAKAGTLTAKDVISSNDVGTLAACILSNSFVEPAQLLSCNEDVKDRVQDSEFYAMVEEGCVPFLRAAAIIKYYGIAHTSQESAFSSNIQSLKEYLFGPIGGSSGTIRWVTQSSTTVLSVWIDEWKLLTSKDFSYLVFDKPLVWSRPRLLPLPKQFDVIFQRYHKAQCMKCRTTPKEILLCLICGDVVCSRDTCCMSNSLTEIETHAVDCGAGTGVYLSVHLSTIMITKDKRAAHWGSLYLDAHGEEDKGLKRGKPLKLSEERFSMLENHWLSHSFDNVCKRWWWIGHSWANIVIPL